MRLSRRRRASSASIWSPTAPTSPTSARFARRALRTFRRWNSCARAICWRTCRPFSAPSTSCSARWTDDERRGGQAMTAGRQLAFDRATGVFDGASAREQLAAYAFWAGARLSSAWSYRGFAAGCRAVRSVLTEGGITVRLNEDALLAFPYGDGYWTLLLDRNYQYEADIELFFKGIADVDYTLVDCGANFGYWSVLTTSKPFGAHRAIAIEPSSRNFAKLTHNGKLNGS